MKQVTIDLIRMINSTIQFTFHSEKWYVVEDSHKESPIRLMWRDGEEGEENPFKVACCIFFYFEGIEGIAYGGTYYTRHSILRSLF